MGLQGYCYADLALLYSFLGCTTDFLILVQLRGEFEHIIISPLHIQTAKRRDLFFSFFSQSTKCKHLPSQRCVNIYCFSHRYPVRNKETKWCRFTALCCQAQSIILHLVFKRQQLPKVVGKPIFQRQLRQYKHSTHS